MNKIFVNNIGDLSEPQRASFYRFLSVGITEELENLSLEYSNGITIQYFKNPTSEQRLKALLYHWDIYQMFDNPTVEETELYEQLKKSMKPNILPRFLTHIKFGENFNR